MYYFSGLPGSKGEPGLPGRDGGAGLPGLKGDRGLNGYPGIFANSIRCYKLSVFVFS